MQNPTTIVVRDLGVDFTNVPRHWNGNSVIATGVSNGLNMLFPHGERFFVRSVKYFLDKVEIDPELRAQIKGFFGQEGRHAREHDRFNAILRAQGYEIDRFLEGYAKLSLWIEERTPPKLNLAITAAAEHFTAILAADTFQNPEFDKVHPAMQQLLAWHAAEEIEHKAVAFDVLQKVDPSYALRITGLVFATVLLSSFWFWGAVTLLKQDGMTWRTFFRGLRAPKGPKREAVLRDVFVDGIEQYLRRDFHPSDNHNTHVAAEWFAARGMSMPEAA